MSWGRGEAGWRERCGQEREAGKKQHHKQKTFSLGGRQADPPGKSPLLRKQNPWAKLWCSKCFYVLRLLSQPDFLGIFSQGSTPPARRLSLAAQSWMVCLPWSAVRQSLTELPCLFFRGCLCCKCTVSPWQGRTMSLTLCCQKANLLLCLGCGFGRNRLEKLLFGFSLELVVLVLLARITGTAKQLLSACLKKKCDLLLIK